MENKTTPLDETILQRNIRILKEQALQNEKRFLEEKMSVDGIITLQEKQVKTQNALMYLRAIEQKVNPPKILKPVNNNGAGIITRP